MQAGGRRSHGAVMRRVHCLVPLAIGVSWWPADVRRQRHCSVLRERGARIERADETNLSQTAAEHLHNFDCAILAKRDAAAWLQFSSGMPHREPGAISQLMDQQDLRVS